MKPTRRLLALTALWSLIGLLPALNLWLPETLSYPDYQSVLIDNWKLAGTTLLALMLLDGFAYFKATPLTIDRQLSATMSLGVWTPVKLTINNSFKQPVQIQLCDHQPADVETQHNSRHITLKPNQTQTVTYKISPLKRGKLFFGLTELLIPSPLGLWRIRAWKNTPSTVKVFPNFTAVSQFALFSLEQKTNQIGIRLQHRRGEGTDFHQLREFRQGDSLRQIDWNASARKRKIISKEYQDEKDQQIIFLLDCGRKMRNKDDKLSHFDHALNAMLLMSYVALKQGDSVGLMSFGGHSRWLKPVKGVNGTSKLLNHVYDLDSTTEASDFSGIAKALRSHHNKRSLVVLITNISDENIDELQHAVRSLQKKHLLMIANIEEPIFNTVLQQPIKTFEQALTYTGTQNYMDNRLHIEQYLHQQGIIMISSAPQELPVKLVNRYMEIKREGLL